MPSNDNQGAIILAAYGAAAPEALRDVLNVKQKIEQAFPDFPIVISFGSRTIRRIWHKRRNDENWLGDNPEVPADLLEVKGPLAAAADLEDLGVKSIAIQSLHIYAGEEYLNLKTMVQSLKGMWTIRPAGRPFPQLALGRPALGEPGNVRDYNQDIAEAASVLKTEVRSLCRDDAAMLYMGHGNRYFSTGVYLELQEELRRQNPEAIVFVASLEGFPPLEMVMEQLRRQGINRVFLTPLLLSVGSHAQKDMAGNHEGSWKNILERNGFEVECLVRGLGRMDSWAELYAQRLSDAMEDQFI